MYNDIVVFINVRKGRPWGHASNGLKCMMLLQQIPSNGGPSLVRELTLGLIRHKLSN